MLTFKNENGFTLIEMLIVLTIITVLILLIVPNLTKKNETVHDRGCEALVKTVQAQVSVYQLEKGSIPSMSDLIDEKYISSEQTTCKNGKKLIVSNGEVKTQNETN